MEDLSTLPDVEGEISPQKTFWISYIENQELERRFNKKKEEFQNKGLNSENLLYHGTSSANTYSICKTNFRLDKSVRFAHGQGIYFSRHPTNSLQYGEDLIVCKVLLGRKQEPSFDEVKDGFDSKEDELKDGFDSKEFRGRNDNVKHFFKNHANHFDAIVIRSVDQILPYCIISAEYPESVKIGGMKRPELKSRCSQQ